MPLNPFRKKSAADERLDQMHYMYPSLYPAREKSLGEKIQDARDNLQRKGDELSNQIQETQDRIDRTRAQVGNAVDKGKRFAKWFDDHVTQVATLGLSQEDPQAQIGIWGSRAAGKTTFMAMLGYAARRRGWAVNPNSKGAEIFMERAMNEIVSYGRFPTATRPAAGEKLAYKYTRERNPMEMIVGQRCTFTLDFFDAAGEWFEGHGLDGGMGIHNPYAYLAGCQGLICLIDPERLTRERNAYLEVIASVLSGTHDYLRRNQSRGGSHGKLPHSIAFAISKVDEEQFWPFRAAPDKFVLDWAGTTAWGHLMQHIGWNKYKLFACSAIGRSGDRPNYEVRNGAAHIRDPQALEPIGLFEPLEWILGVLGSPIHL